MAVTAIWDIRGRIDKVIAYAVNSEKTQNGDYNVAESFHVINDVVEYAANDLKTEEKLFVTGINTDVDNATTEFVQTKKKWLKTGGIVAYHGYQSFAEDEVDAEAAHDIGVELAKRLWGERFEVIVATHCNTGHFHNHFVINSVSYKDGKRYYDNKESYKRMRRESDRLCIEYGLSIVYKPKGTKKPYIAWQDEQSGRTTKFDIYRRDIDAAIRMTRNVSGFLSCMKDLGYEVITSGKYPRFREFGRTKFHRMYKLGEDYTFDAIRNRIWENFYYREYESEKYDMNDEDFPVYDKNFENDLYKMYSSYRVVIEYYIKHPYIPKYIHPLLREDILKLEQLDRQARFLARTKIKTMEELRGYQDKVKSEIDILLKERNNLRNKLKRSIRAGNEAEVKETKVEISALSASISRKRKEDMLCEKIAEYSTQIPKCLSFVSGERNIENEEVNSNEYIRRSGRTNRKNEPERS